MKTNFNDDVLRAVAYKLAAAESPEEFKYAARDDADKLQLFNMWNNALNRRTSDLIDARNIEMREVSDQPRYTPFAGGVAVTGIGAAGGGGIGNVLKGMDRFKKVKGFRRGAAGAGAILAALGLMAKDLVAPGKTRLPASVADKWVDPTVGYNYKEPTMWESLLRRLSGKRNEEWNDIVPTLSRINMDI